MLALLFLVQKSNDNDFVCVSTLALSSTIPVTSSPLHITHILSSVACLALPYFSTLSHERRHFWKHFMWHLRPRHCVECLEQQETVLWKSSRGCGRRRQAVRKMRQPTQCPPAIPKARQLCKAVWCARRTAAAVRGVRVGCNKVSP